MTIPNIGKYVGVTKVDQFLNSFTMYRVVLYGLSVLVVIALGLSASGTLGYPFADVLLTLGILLVVCQGSNIGLAKLLEAPRNVESAYITALILFFIMLPSTEPKDMLVTAVAGFLAMAAKYVLAMRHKHLFNPVAVSLVILNLVGSGNAYWWVANKYMFWPVLIIGLLITRKTRRFHVVATFLAVAVVGTLLLRDLGDVSVFEQLKAFALSWPFIFFATVMLTEPLTSPPTRRLRVIYAAIVGVLYSVSFDFALGTVVTVYSTPQLALVLGNIFSYIVSPKQRLKLAFIEKTELAPDTYEYTFTSNTPLGNKAGQYLEWTLPHIKSDTRGNRRYFTVACSPTEDVIRLAVRLDRKRSSSFKKALHHLKPGKIINASQLAGDFILPTNRSKKLVFVAGGIGVTPFRSMVQYMADTQQKRDIVMYYTSLTSEGFAYKDFLDEAAPKIGMNMQYVLTNAEAAPRDWPGKIGYLDAEMIKRDMADYKGRTYYLSGPNAMVDAYKVMLTAIGIPRRQIVTDYFPGF